MNAEVVVRQNPQISKESLATLLRCTVILFLLPFNFVESRSLAFLLPAFLTGYVIINIIGGITTFYNQIEIYADISFLLIGTCTTVSCTVLLFWNWIILVIKMYEAGHGDYGIDYMLLWINCFLNATTMIYQLIIYARERSIRFTPRRD